MFFSKEENNNCIKIILQHVFQLEENIFKRPYIFLLTIQKFSINENKYTINNSLSTGFKSRNKEMAKPETDNILHCKKHKNTNC